MLWLWDDRVLVVFLGYLCLYFIQKLPLMLFSLLIANAITPRADPNQTVWAVWLRSTLRAILSWFLQVVKELSIKSLIISQFSLCTWPVRIHAEGSDWIDVQVWTKWQLHECPVCWFCLLLCRQVRQASGQLNSVYWCNGHNELLIGYEGK